MGETDIVYENDRYWVSTAKAAGFRWKGYCVWEKGITVSTLRARIGYAGKVGYRRAVAEADRRLRAA